MDFDRRNFLKYAGIAGIAGGLTLANARNAFASTVLTNDYVQADDIKAPTGRSATLVIAAADSSAKSKAQADYVCDGTADDVEIQAAIDALPITGGKIQLLEGLFNLSNEISITTNGVNLSGLGWSTKLKINTPGAIGISVGGVPAISNVVLSDFYLFTEVVSSHGIKFSQNTKFSNINRVALSGIRGVGIYFTSETVADGNSWNLIDACLIYSFYNHGIRLDSGSNMVHINNCHFVNQLSESGKYAISVASCDAAIHGNRMHQCEGGIELKDASCATFTVIGNYMQNIHRNGIALSNGAQHGNVQGNTIYYPSDLYSNYYSGIVMEDTIYTVVTGNVIKGLQTGNRPKYGITMVNSYGTTQENIVSLNIIENCSTATLLPIVNNNTIHNNRGYVDTSTGTATITATATTVEVTHGLAAAPTRVIISPTTATAGKQYYVSAKTATTFTITIDSAHSADISFDWQAVV